ncbi:hypothetical protein Barb6XT_02938 [Bacteroidales bacterium Barb6XT]|nr:hypothetical protein Barb6XT_02938 [Bacteroidales bacterium Barb6XT]
MKQMIFKFWTPYPKGHLRNIRNYYFSTVKLDIVTIIIMSLL